VLNVIYAKQGGDRMNKIRTLNANEIDVRVQSVAKDDRGAILLLYKDARVDMNILDETFGPSNWQRSHEVIDGKLFCNVGIRFEREDGTFDWVYKQDVGIESYNEKEKGQASDSFKRACFNWGIGRELYTAPFIWVSNMGDMKDRKCYTKFSVSHIEYNENREIIGLVIVDDKGRERYKLGALKPNNNKNTSTVKSTNQGKQPTMDKEVVDASLASDKQLNLLYSLVKQKNYGNEAMAKYIKQVYNKDNSKHLTKKEASELINMLQGMGE